jgi:hypothetical protein
MVESILQQYSSDEVMLDAFLQWALNPTSASAGYGLEENYQNIESNLSRVHRLSRGDAARVVQKLRVAMAQIIKNREIYEIREAIKKSLEGNLGTTLRQGLRQRLLKADEKTQRFATLLSQLLEDVSPDSLGSDINYAMECLVAIYVAAYGEMPPPETIKGGLLDAGVLYSLQWITARRYYHESLVIMPFLRQTTAEIVKPVALPDVSEYVRLLFEQPNHELLRLLDEVANSRYGSIFGVAKAPEGMSSFVSARGISGKYRDIMAISPFIQPQLQMRLSREKEKRLEPFALKFDRALTDMRNRLYPKCELMWQDVGKEQRLWIWEAVNCPRLYIYLAPWVTSQGFSRLYFDGKDPHLLVFTTHQAIPLAKSLIEKRFFGPCSVVALSGDKWIYEVVRGEKHPYLDDILSDLSGSRIQMPTTEEAEHPGQAPEVRPEREQKEPERVEMGPELCIGSENVPPQYGLLGWTGEKKLVFFDLNSPKTVSIFGRPEAGKSYTVGAIAEMSLLNIPKLNHLIVPLSVIVFHYSKDERYKPEYVTLRQPNDRAQEVEVLKSSLGVSPVGVKDVVIVVPPHKLEKRRQEYAGLEVHPLQFNPAELRMDDWLMLMAASGTEALYIEELKRILKSLESKGEVSLQGLYESIETSQLNKTQQKLATTRLGIAEQYMLENATLKQLVSPGSLTLLDLRDEMLESEEAMRLCLIALKLFSNVKTDGHGINKLIILDEAHKYMGSAFAMEIETVVREMRHTASSVIIASQDPLSIPDKVIGLSSVVICHRITDGRWVKHIKSSCEPLSALDPAQLSQLKPGEAFVWADKANVSAFVTGQVKVQIRPRVTKHGGYTVTAV